MTRAELGRLYRLGPLAWRWELTPSMLGHPPVLHFELQLNLVLIILTLVISREL